jgi:glyoxylase-like metal-dependent hydrolase (beta-lactamase superfamily II)
MILKQYYLGCLAHASYLVGDEEAKSAAVVDPQRDVDQYLRDAERLGVRIGHVLLTHFHADFLAGHLELRERTGARIHLGAAAEAEFEFTPMHDGGTLPLGRILLKFMETPGHTPEGVSIAVFDLGVSEVAPHAVLTGDTLFVGDVGRPDLMASVGLSAAELAGRLYRSLRDKLLTLPDATLVYPAHGAGSMCGRQLSTETVSTIGDQRRFNYALQPMSEEEFVRMMTADQPEAPRYFSHAARLNRSERATLDESLARMLRPLLLDEVLRMAADGAQLLDVRGAASHAASHLRGAINIGLDGKFATWAGSLLDRERPIILIGDPGTEPEGATRLGRIGLDRVAGYLETGMLALRGRDDLLEQIARIDPSALQERLGRSDPPALLDVRNAREWEEARIEGSVNVPLAHLERRIAELPSDGALVVYCATGYRSSTAAGILQRHGRSAVLDLAGGFSAWQAGGHPAALAAG